MSDIDWITEFKLCQNSVLVICKPGYSRAWENMEFSLHNHCWCAQWDQNSDQISVKYLNFPSTPSLPAPPPPTPQKKKKKKKKIK